MNKPILCFMIGYTPDINDKEIKNTYGSEITLIKLANEFSKKYRIVIFGNSISNETTVNNIEFLNSNKFEQFQKNNVVDVTIISRYLSVFLDYEIKSKKIFLWVHDVYPQPYYEGIVLKNNGRELVRNLIDKIDGVIALTNWHKEYLEYYYDIDNVYVISSAIDTKMFKGNFKKQKNKFIWTSHGYRGINKMLEYFHVIRKRIPDAELYVYRDKTAFSDEDMNEMLKYNYIHYKGKLNHNKIPEEFESSEIWFYPTNFDESYCMSAVEAQMSKCVCVTTDIAALSETVGDRGVLIKEPIYSEEYKETAINEIVNILTNNKLKKEYQEKGYKWAIEQTWENRAKKWYELF